MSLIRVTRATREALEAAAEVFAAAGWPTREEKGGKHWLIIATAPDGGEHRLPVPSTPSGGVEAGVKLARRQATKVVRRYGWGVAA